MNHLDLRSRLMTGFSLFLSSLLFAAFGPAFAFAQRDASDIPAVTIAPAEMFGVAADFGSIEAGKEANFMISDSDPLETATQIAGLFIDGFNVPIDSQHFCLYEESLNRDEGRIQSVEVIRPAN